MRRMESVCGERRIYMKQVRQEEGKIANREASYCAEGATVPGWGVIGAREGVHQADKTIMVNNHVSKSGYLYFLLISCLPNRDRQ